jgi:photosystem II stability/assembly factor-like uncharacterized protein
MNLRRLLTLGLLACSVVSAAARWDSVYFYDEATKVLEFLDIAAPSAQRIIAVGSIHDLASERRDRYVAMVTNNAGDRWQEVKLDDAPVSLFFLNDSLGWMVTEHGVWRTEESGLSWTRVSKHRPEEIVRVWFLDDHHGFSVGVKKNVVETNDGGRTWKQVPGTKTAPGNPNLSIYTRIVFVNPKVGIILGADLSTLSQVSRSLFRVRPSTRILQLVTDDGGVTWKPQSAPSGGLPGALKFDGDDELMLIQFSDNRGNELSNVFHIPPRRNGAPSVVYQGKDLTVTDLGFLQKHAFLAGVEAAKNRQTEGIPRKVRILESTGTFKLWNEMEIDYKAEANRVIFAAADPDHAFVATDTGMILRLRR